MTADQSRQIDRRVDAAYADVSASLRVLVDLDSPGLWEAAALHLRAILTAADSAAGATAPPCRPGAAALAARRHLR
jgi:hypothetical protein